MAKRKVDSPVMLPFSWLLLMGVVAIFSYHKAESHWLLANVGALLFIMPFVALAGFIILRNNWKEDFFKSFVWTAVFVVAPIYGYIHFTKQPIESFPPKAGLRLATYNVDYYSYDQRNIEERVNIINTLNADIIAILELNKPWIDEVRMLQDNYPYTYYGTEETNRGGAGIVALFSKYPILSSDVHNDGHIVHHKIQITEEDVYNVIQFDPMPPINRALVDARTETYNALMELPLANNTFIMGDFNAVSWQKDMQNIIGKFNLKNATKNWPTWPNPLPIAPLDNVLVTEPVHTSQSASVCMEGSDHCLVYADVVNYLK